MNRPGNSRASFGRCSTSGGSKKIKVQPLSVRSADRSQRQVWANRFDPVDGWAITEPLSEEGKYVLAPTVAVDETGNAIALYAEADQIRLNIWARRYVRDEGWSGARRIQVNNSGSALFSAVSRDSKGRGLAIWRPTGGGLTTAAIRIIHLNVGVAMVDVADGGDPTVLEASLVSGEATRTFERESGPRTFDFLGPGEGDVRFSTEEQTFDEGKEYVLVLLPDPDDTTPNSNQTVTVEIDREAIGEGDAGVVLIHGSEISTLDGGNIALSEIDEGLPSPPIDVETGVRIGARTEIQSLRPGEYGFSLLFEPPMPATPTFLSGRRVLVGGEFVVAIGGEAILNTTAVDGWFALAVDNPDPRQTLELLTSFTPICVDDDDCRLFSSDCDGCTCVALPADLADPVCGGQIVSCVIDPCTPMAPKYLMGECSAAPN